MNTAFAEGWNGSTWTLLNVPNAPKTSLNAVACRSATDCVAVGDAVPANQDETVPLAEIWNGSAWTLSTPGQPSGAALSVLPGVSCPSTADCTAVGGWGATTGGSLVPLAAQYS